MRFLTRDDGVRLAYEIHNPDGAATPLLLTHGFAATSQMWSSNLEALAKDRPVLVWDLRGHGRSDAPAEPARYDARIAVEDMGALLDAAGFRRAILGGLSVGGYLSLAFHDSYPHRVAGLVLVDTGPGYKSDASRAAWNQQVEEVAAKLETGDRSVLHSPEMMRAEHDHPEALARAARVMAQHDGGVIGSLPSISLPVLVVVGANDAAYLGGAEYMASRIPGARKVILPDAGHSANVDQPELFDAAASDFLEGL